MAIETPEYKIISKREGFEVRRYSDMVIATTKVQADYKASTSSGEAPGKGILTISRGI